MSPSLWTKRASSGSLLSTSRHYMVVVRAGTRQSAQGAISGQRRSSFCRSSNVEASQDSSPENPHDCDLNLPKFRPVTARLIPGTNKSFLALPKLLNKTAELRQCDRKVTTLFLTTIVLDPCGVHMASISNYMSKSSTFDVGLEKQPILSGLLLATLITILNLLLAPRILANSRT